MLFQDITRLETLAEGWQRVKRNAGGPGGDGMRVEEFDHGSAHRLLRLQRDLRGGTYRPGPVRTVEIPKSDGSLRRLSIPCVVDRVAQSAAALVLTPLLDQEMEDSSFGYRPGRSVGQAVRRIAAHYRQGFHWVVDGDIERYFDNVPHDGLIERLKQSIGDDALTLELITLWLQAFAPTGRGLPQGGPLSPLLANLYLDAIDEQIHKRGVRLVRFADDFVLLCRTEAKAEGALRKIADLLDVHGLRLHPDKTRVVSFDKGFRFLGHLFVRAVVLPESYADDPAFGVLPSLGSTNPAAAPPAFRAADGGAVDMAALDELPGGARAPGLRVMYVTRPGTRLTLHNQAFALRDATEVDGVELLAVPPQRVDRIELHPDTQLDQAVIRHALAHSVDVALVDGHGHSVGHLRGPGGRNGLHMAQARALLDPDRRQALATTIVDARLRNQRALLRRLNRRRKDDRVAAAAVAIGQMTRRLSLAPDIPALMGHEGRAAAFYWPALGHCLEHGWRLRRRRRHPPPDPVNVTLSLLSSLLERDVASFLERRSLHAGFGLLHTPRDGFDALPSDIMEEFRAPLIESLTIYLFNNRLLKREMFMDVPGGACRISADGYRTVVRGYEAWLDRAVKSPRSGDKLKWRRIIDEQVLAWADHVQDAGRYRPYIMDY